MVTVTPEFVVKSSAHVVWEAPDTVMPCPVVRDNDFHFPPAALPHKIDDAHIHRFVDRFLLIKQVWFLYFSPIELVEVCRCAAIHQKFRSFPRLDFHTGNEVVPHEFCDT
ncbi:MAG: hypothetical protein A2535_12670 [Burkholderiales bacterium RIFOXYD2_FULL_59_8]|nr:MAG: hypothetical protein A2535_12670 [Burkholderiales bacterium RIFOXYD2_FULL_59_8]